MKNLLQLSTQSWIGTVVMGINNVPLDIFDLELQRCNYQPHCDSEPIVVISRRYDSIIIWDNYIRLLSSQAYPRFHFRVEKWITEKPYRTTMVASLHCDWSTHRMDQANYMENHCIHEACKILSKICGPFEGHIIRHY
jgi:hypothetical protein